MDIIVFSFILLAVFASLLVAGFLSGNIGSQMKFKRFTDNKGLERIFEDIFNIVEDGDAIKIVAVDCSVLSKKRSIILDKLNNRNLTIQIIISNAAESCINFLDDLKKNITNTESKILYETTLIENGLINTYYIDGRETWNDHLILISKANKGKARIYAEPHIPSSNHNHKGFYFRGYDETIDEVNKEFDVTWNKLGR